MTVIDIVRQSHAVHLLADGVAANAAGETLPSVKLWSLPHLPAIIGMRGPAMGSFPNLLAHAFWNYDDMRARIPLVLAAYVEGLDDKNVDVMIGGISGSGRPESFSISSADKSGRKPWVVEDLGNLVLAPINDAIRDAVRAEFLPLGSYDAWIPAIHGVRLVEIQRQHWVEPDFHPPDGFIQLMSLYADGLIVTKVIHRWEMATKPAWRKPAAELVGA